MKLRASELQTILNFGTSTIHIQTCLLYNARNGYVNGVLLKFLALVH